MTGNEGPLVLAILGLTLALGGLFILARVITRTLIKPQFGLDDVFIIITWFVLLGFSTAYFVAVSHGYGRHAADLSLPDLLAAGRASIIGEVLVVWAFPTGKAAVAYLLIRIFPIPRLRWFLWVFVAINAILFYLNGILLLVQCRPVAFQWDKSIQGGTCWSPEVLEYWGYVTGAVGAFTDFAFAVVPWFYIARLNMNLRKKIIVSIALGAGLLPFICSILKIYYTSTLGSAADPTYDTIPLLLAGAAEACAINIAACLPTLRPLWLWVTGDHPKSFSITPYVYDPERGKYGSHSRLWGVFSRKKASGTELSSIESSSIQYDRNQIVQHRTYGVTIEDRRASEAKTDTTAVSIADNTGKAL